MSPREEKPVKEAKGPRFRAVIDADNEIRLIHKHGKRGKTWIGLLVLLLAGLIGS